MEKMGKARRYARVKHAGQTRDGTDEPYVNHVERVAEYLTDAGVVDPSVICAALLHDTVEDTTATQEDLRMEFGDTVAYLVEQVSLPKTLKRGDKRRLEYSKVRALDPRAALIKLADKLDNVCSMANSDWSRDEQREYFEHVSALVDAMAMTFAGRREMDRLLTLADAQLAAVRVKLFY